MSVFGTARVLKEVAAYNDLTNVYDDHTAYKLVQYQLDQAGITHPQFVNFLRVYRKLQLGALDVPAARERAIAATAPLIAAFFDVEHSAGVGPVVWADAEEVGQPV